MAELHNKLHKQMTTSLQWSTKEFLTGKNEIYSLNIKLVKMT